MTVTILRRCADCGTRLGTVQVFDTLTREPVWVCTGCEPKPEPEPEKGPTHDAAGNPLDAALVHRLPADVGALGQLAGALGLFLAGVTIGGYVAWEQYGAFIGGTLALVGYRVAFGLKNRRAR